MLLFTVVIVACEVWNSEATAAFGLALGALAALLTPTSAASSRLLPLEFWRWERDFAGPP
jgi:hypothetical protein